MMTGPDLIRIVLHPPSLRKNLSEFPLRHGANRAIVIEDNRTGTGGALIERENDGHGWGRAV